MQPFFSIIIPLYNKEDYIEATLKSVLSQSFQDFEIIVVNDGSTDESLNIVKQIESDKVVMFSNENRGLSATRNFGIEKAKSNYVAFLDADDLWKKDYLETMFKLIKAYNGHSVFCTNVNLFYEYIKNHLQGKNFNLKYALVLNSFSDLLEYTPGFSSIVIDKSVFKSVGGFNEAVNFGEEHDFFIRCFAQYDLVFYTDSKVYYRKGVSNQLTAPNKNFQRIIPDYNAYLTHPLNHDLKRYIDFIHYKLSILYKMELNTEMSDLYKKKIHLKNLRCIQKIKLSLPTFLFYYSKTIYVWFSRKLTH